MPPLRTFFYLFCAFIDILSSQNKNFPDIFRSFGRENQPFADCSSCFAIEGPRNGGLVLIKKRNFQPIGFIQKKNRANPWPEASFARHFPVNRRFPSCQPLPEARQQPCFLLLVSLSVVCGGGVSARAHRSPPAPRGADPTPSAGDGPPRLPPFLPVSGIAEGAGRSRRDRPSRARGAFSPSAQVCAPVHRSKGGKESRSPLGRS